MNENDKLRNAINRFHEAEDDLARKERAVNEAKKALSHARLVLVRVFGALGVVAVIHEGKRYMAGEDPSGTVSLSIELWLDRIL